MSYDPDDTITVDVASCARCGQDHASVVFRPLTFPIEMDSGEPDLTHWAACPNNGQPILMRRVTK